MSDCAGDRAGQKRKVQSAEEIAKDALTCKVCLELILPPVQQCPEGHTICDPCLDGLPGQGSKRKQCPTCRTDFSNKRVRNLLADQLAELIPYPCPHNASGCTETMPPSQLSVHAKACEFNPKVVRCPVKGCTWRGEVGDFQDHMLEVECFNHTRAKPNTVSAGKKHILIQDEFLLRSEMVEEIWKELGWNVGDESKSQARDELKVICFYGSAFCLHCVLNADGLKLGVCMLTRPQENQNFRWEISVVDRDETNGFQRFGNVIPYEQSMTELMQRPTCLVIDTESVEALAHPTLCGPMVHLKCRITNSEVAGASVGL